jgi:hypothetical protein
MSAGSSVVGGLGLVLKGGMSVSWPLCRMWFAMFPQSFE